MGSGNNVLSFQQKSYFAFKNVWIGSVKFDIKILDENEMV